MALRDEIQAFIEGEEIRGRIREDGGDIGFDDLKGKTVHITMGAACADCPSGSRTVNQFVEKRVRHAFGDDLQVVARFVKPYFKG